jgi:sterol desaturase/sphingolipid hydroxylase (fatty acid hydroxylase superfamily)
MDLTHSSALPTAPAHPPIAYGLYPVVAAITAAGVALALVRNLDRNAVVGVLTVVTIVICFVVERRHPLRSQWQMTKQTLVERDLPFIGLGFVVEQLAATGVALIAAATIPPDGFGPLGRLPLVIQVMLGLVAFDLLWYGYHRAAHTYARLWRVHGLHHAPSQLYLLMHPVFHPLDLVVSRFLFSLLVFRFTGLTPDAAFVVIVMLNLQQTVSHLNVDVRVGPLNYLLIGTETHRYHHSAQDAGNFSSALALWDQAFGTFIYQPRQLPARLGLFNPDDYPDPRRFHATLAWPFRRA